jgi:D-alanyl-D-alanine carboxypeptidase
MQKYLDKGIRKYNIHGASAVVIQDGHKTWIGVSGVSHDTVSMSPDMIFGIGSVSKIIMATLTLKLVEDDVLTLDDHISKWLPSMEYVSDSITIRQLLSHTSGLFNLWDNEQIWDDLFSDRKRNWSPEEVLTYMEDSYFAPGESFHYSNVNYLLTAMIIETATGVKLGELLKRKLWQPLALDDVYLSLHQELPENLAHIYGDDYLFGGIDEDVTFEPRISHESVIFGSSGIFTSAHSLARFASALFEGHILKPETLTEMLQFVEFKPFSNMSGYGLGVQHYSKGFTQGNEAIGHGGGNIGTTTYLIYLPDYNATIVVMINAFPNAGADYIAKGIIRSVSKRVSHN